MKIAMTAVSRRTVYYPSARPFGCGNKRPYAFAQCNSASCSSTSSSSNNNNSDAAATGGYGSTLSSARGRAAVGLLPSYLADARAVEPYSLQNPSGALQLGVAESKMLEDWLVPALNAEPPAPLPASAIYYQPTSGRADFKQVLSSYLEDLCDLSVGQLNHDGLIVGAGCNAVLENLCFSLADAGESVLIPTPYYAAFEFDLVARAGLAVEPVTTEDFHPDVPISSSVIMDPCRYFPNAAALDAAYERAEDKGNSPKVLLISHPMNPLGICYPIETIQECISWCRARKVHLISDEIYAGSAYGETFTSALKLAGPDIGPYVHWVYAFSKDFALSGMRVGAAYTENPEIILPMQKLNDLCQISSQTQLWTASMLKRNHNEKELWTIAFRRKNHKRLRDRSTRLTAILNKYQIPYLRPTAGLFVWIDLSRFLPVGKSDESPEVRERALYLELVQKYGLLFTPGCSMRNERPGFFRCVFTAASANEFEVALQRIESFLAEKAK
jgi:aspartate/methionine/tyrosine aminotransferase